jgi:hypothetical protein
LRTKRSNPASSSREEAGLLRRFAPRNDASNWKELRMAYVDGFIVAVPKKNIDAYKKLSKLCGKV